MKKKIIICIIILLIIIFVILMVSVITSIKTNPENVKLYFLRLEDADCNIIKHKNKIIMIDTGEKKDQDKIEEKMQELKISNIDYLILTHPDKDHIGNVKYLIENYNVKNVIQTDYNKESNIQNEMNETIENSNIENLILKEQKQINIDEIKLEIYPPEKQYEISSRLTDNLDNSKTVTILKEIIETVHSLGVKVICEDFDTKEHEMILRKIGCDRVQGNAYYQPIPTEELIKG